MSVSEPTITCPACRADIKLTDSLAAPLVESTRAAYEKKIGQMNVDVARREQAIRDREAQLAREKEVLDQQVLEKLNVERAKISADESKKAKLAIGNDLELKTKEIGELQQILKAREEKLAEAQKAQAEVIRQQRELEDARREMDLTIEKRIGESLLKVRETARKEAEDSLQMKVMEKEQTIAAMSRQIEELKRRAEQGSQQLQGEVQELILESLLGGKFPHDKIDSVPKGEHGGDILQRVATPTGLVCGTILWESKRTKNWIDGWLPKLRDDQRAAKAEIAVLVSANLPKGVETFDQVDGIWVTHPRAILPVALSLRHMLIEVSGARQASEGQQTKMEMIYQYLTGPRFRLRVEAMIEAFNNMDSDLQLERKMMMKQWAKREKQIERIMEATVGMYGELQGIAGSSLKEIEGMDMKLLGDESVKESVVEQAP